MKKFLLSLATGLLIFTSFQCDGQSKEVKDSAPPAAALKASNTISSDLPPRKEACEFLSIRDIAEKLDWDAEKMTQEIMMKLERYNKTVCHYYTKDGENFTLRISWKKEKAQQNKVLENQFKSYLTNGETNLSYQSTSSKKGSESIFGTGPDRDDKTIYIFRTRFENTAEVILEGAFRNNNSEKYLNIFQQMLMELY